MDEIDESKQIVLQIGGVLKKYRKKKHELRRLSGINGCKQTYSGEYRTWRYKSNFGDYMENFKGISLPLLALLKSEDPVSLYRAGEGLRFSNDQKIGSLNRSLKTQATILKCVGLTYSRIARITLKVIM